METQSHPIDKDLSIIITAHAEGQIADKTLLSIKEALKPLKKHGYTFEIIVNIDRGDKQTNEYFSKYRDNKLFTILETDFGDLGLSRNHALKHAKGKNVAFLDADDMISENWYLNALRHIENSSYPVVVHPKANIIFGDNIETTLCIFRNSHSRAVEALYALGTNRWISTSMARRKTYENTPYMPTKNGFGHEDYFFNMQTIEKGIKHEVANNTTHFYRRRQGSLMVSSNRNHATQPYAELLDIRRLQALPPITMLPHYARTKMIPPTYVKSAIAAISKIDQTVVLPDDAFTKGLPVFDPDTNNKEVTPAFLRVIKDFKKYPKIIVITDKPNSTEVKAFLKEHSGIPTTVIITSFEPRTNLNVPELEFGENARWLNDNEKDILLTRLIIQSKCRGLAIINSKEGKKWLACHEDLVKNNYKCYT